MSRFSKAMSVVVACLIPCLAFGAGDTPISNLKLTSNANGGNFAFTNLSLVAATSMTVSTTATSGTQVVNWKAMTNYVAAFAGGLTTNSSPTMAPGTVWTFSLANVTNNADSGTEVVNWQTMTGYVASATSGFLTNGQANVNFGTNLMVRGNPVLTNETLWLAFAATGGVVNGGVTVHGDTWLDGNVYVSQTLYVTNMYVTNIWTTITNLNVQGDGVITGDLTVSNVFRAGTIYGSMDATNIVNAPWLTNNQSGVTFGSLSVTSDATAGQQVVNWRTMTGYVAQAIAGTTNVPPLSSVLSAGNMANMDINLGSNNLREVTGLYFQGFDTPAASIQSSPGQLEIFGPVHSNSIMFVTSPTYAGILHGIGESKWKVDVDATNGQEIVNWQTMTNYMSGVSVSSWSSYPATNIVRLTNNAIAYEDMLASASAAYQSGGSDIFNDDTLGGKSFATTATTNIANDHLTFVYQTPHRRKSNTHADPHMHFWQTNADQTNCWFMTYTWAALGTTNYTELGPFGPASNQLAYVGGTMHQLATFPELMNTNSGISGILRIKLYRFGTRGTGAITVTDLDCHYEVDGFGSDQELSKSY